MPRPKEFDPEQALTRAVEVFWDNGYAKTSLDQLMAGMGVARQSLYDTFGDKRSLYLRSLEHYRDTNHAALRELFGSGRPVRECFAELLGGLCDEPKAAHRRGCLLLSANLEREQDDAEVAQLLRGNQDALERIFAQALERARDTGELRREADPRALARFFLSTIQGMRAFARVHPGRTGLQQIADVALKALD